MARPVYHPSSDRIYDGLPSTYRELDRVRDYPLLRYLSSISDQLGEAEDWLDVGLVELMDPATADASALPWLSQLVGVRFTDGASEQSRRDAIASGNAGWRAGSRVSLRESARSALTGTRYVRILPHLNPGGGSTIWDVTIETLPSETPSPQDVLDAVLSKRVVPAGVVLYHRYYSNSWDQFETDFTNWTAIGSAGSWNTLEGL